MRRFAYANFARLPLPPFSVILIALMYASENVNKSNDEDNDLCAKPACY